MTIVNFLGVRTGVGGTTSPPPPLTGVPDRLPTGIIARSWQRALAPGVMPLLQAGPGGSTVVEVTWRVIQPVAGAALVEAQVLNVLAEMDAAWAQRPNPLPVMMRVFGGWYAPDNARSDAGGPAPGGGMTWYVNDGNIGTGPPAPSDPTWFQLPRPMPCFWKPIFAEYATDLLRRLMADQRISGHPAFCGITLFGPMTQYAEPLMWKPRLLEHRTNANAAGYNETDRWNSFVVAMQAHKDFVTPAGAATQLSFNDWQSTNPANAIIQSQPRAIELMELYVATMGRMGVIENNSLRVPATIYVQLYARMREMRAQTAPWPVPLYFQTETLPKHEDTWDTQPLASKITTPAATVELAIAWGSHGLEMPNGAHLASTVAAADHNPPLATAPVGTRRWDGWTVAQAADWNTRMAALASGLDVYHSAGAVPPAAAIDGGNPSVVTSDVVDGGSPVTTVGGITDGGAP